VLRRSTTLPRGRSPEPGLEGAALSQFRCYRPGSEIIGLARPLMPEPQTAAPSRPCQRFQRTTCRLALARWLSLAAKVCSGWEVQPSRFLSRRVPCCSRAVVAVGACE
jgi:hypothetical protein